MKFQRLMLIETGEWEFIKHPEDSIIFVLQANDEVDYIENNVIGNDYDKFESVCRDYLSK